MTSLAGYATLMNPTTQVVCAYAAQSLTLEATVGERWVVQGSFTVPERVECRMAVEGFVAGPARLHVALFNPSKIVLSEVTTEATVPETPVRSDIITLEPNITYQIGMRVYSLVEHPGVQGTSRTVHLVDP